MSIRNVTLAITVSIAATMAAFGQPGTGYVFQLPGQNASSSQIVAYPYAANPLAPAINTLGPTGTYQVIAKVDGSGYYVLGTTLQIANNAFTTFTTINGIATAPTAIATSPDGNYAVVGAGDVYIISASTSQILLDTNTGGTVVGIAISRDSKYAYVLTNTFTTSTVTQINLVTKAKVATLPFQYSGGTGIAFSPQGLLYVGAVNRIYEIDPVALQLTPGGDIGINATPGPLRFTPDGTTLYFANTSSNVSGGSIVQITLATYAQASWPPATGSKPPPIDDVLIAGNGRIFAISYANTTLYDVTTSPLGLTVSTLNNTLNGQTQSVLSAAVSNELPSALYLYLVVATAGQNTLYIVNLSNNQIVSQTNSGVSNGLLAFVGVPPQTGAAAFLTFNNNQTVAQGSTSLPLVARVLDLTGRPIFNQAVTFTTDATNGVVINSPSLTTNADGYVQTTITTPKVQGTYTITLTAGTANTSFTINVPGTGGSGGTGPGGVTQVFIVTGDGQLVKTGTSTGESGDSLTVLVTDVNGAPLAGVAVTFAVTSGTGNIASFYYVNGNPGGVTDANGLARADFVGGIPAQAQDFEQDTVVATTPYGSVSFTEVEYASIIQGSNQPAFPPYTRLLTPTVDMGFTVTVAEGSVAQNAVTASIVASTIPQAGQNIQGVGLRIIDPNNPPAPSPYASCKGSTLSDNSGVAHCSVVATCGYGPGSYAVGYMIGDLVYFPGTVVVTQGAGQTLTIASGNNQSGPAGSQLPVPLVATVTDGCGTPVPGIQVTFKVTSGSATLTNVVGTSGASGGRVSTNVTFGAAAGPVQVTATLGTSSVVTFSLTSQAVISSLTKLSGDNQTTTINSAFAQPLTVQLTDATGAAVAGASVNFLVSSGNATISPSSAVTDSQGKASTIATAIQTTGAVIVTASYASVSATFSLTVVPQGPQVTAANFQNAASFQTGLVPCGLATATGAGLATGITGTVSGVSFFGPLQYILNGVQLSVNGVPAPIYQLSNTNGKQQVTFQTPCEVTPGANGTVVINVSGASTTVSGVPILAVQPGIFYYTGANGKAYGAVIGADGNYVTATNPAKRGQNYYLIATGLGAVTPATATDSVGLGGQSVVNQTIVGVSNLGVPVFAQVYQANEIGVYAIGFTIPLTNPTGVDQPLALAEVVNGQTIFGNGVFLPAVQ